MTAYLVALLTSVGFYALLALALNLQFGLTGLVNFGVAGFYAVGAYAAALAADRLGLPPGLGLLAAMALAGLAGLALAALSARLAGDYLAIATLGFAELVRLVALNEDWLTRGPRGLSLPPAWLPAGLDRMAQVWLWLGIIALAVLLAFLLLERLRRSPFGRLLRAVREDPLVPAVLGRDVQDARLRAFAIGGAVMGGAGALYAQWILSISPDHFQTPITMLAWMAVVVGGAGNLRGTLLGALLVVAIFEGSRFLGSALPGLDAERLAALRIMLVGVALILAIRLRPRGLLPEARTRTAHLANTTGDPA